MRVTATVDTGVDPARLFAWVEDLRWYPAWLGIVTDARLDAEDGRPAWRVALTGRLGPFARSKRLRMIRTVHQPNAAVVFERDEADGRQHAPWTLRADVAPIATGARLTMNLHYGGALWGPVLERLLADEVERARRRLPDLVSSGPPGGAGASR